MKPSIEIDSEQKLIITHLKDNMKTSEIYEFIDDLYASLNSLQVESKELSLLNHASEKGFESLDSARELPEAFGQLLSDNHIKKFATVRPQADYYSENVELYPGKFKIFNSEDNARDWLEN